jgi:hypothetical protein
MLIHNAEVTGSLNINNVPFNSGSFSGSFQGDGSQLTGITGASTASYVEYNNVGNKPSLVSSSAQIVGYGIFATTGSNQFNGSQAITGSLTVTGQVVAQTLNVQQVTSSIVYSSGSNIFGNSLSNTQQFTGSVSVTGSLTVNGTSAVTGTGTTNYLPKFTGSTTIGNSQIFDNGSNVGIGTALPSAGLEIETDGSVKTALRVTSNQAFNASPVTAIMFRYRISSGTTIGGAVINAAKDNATESNQAGNLQFWTNNGTTLAERMRITSGGNVGIGATPSAWNTTSRALQLTSFVSLSQQHSGALNLMSYAIESSANSFTYGDTGVYPTRLNMNPNDGVITFSNAVTGTAGNAVTFTPRLTILNNGNVGIGTDIPANRLQVHVSSNDTGGFNDASYPLQLRNTSTTANSYVGIYLAGSFGVGATIETQFVSPSTSSEGILKFATRNSSGAIAERMRITSGGDVGIGTLPNSKFEIRGSTSSPQFRISRSEQTNQGLTIQAGGGVTLFDSYDGTDTVFGSYTFNSTKGTNTVTRMRIDGSGNVGIGTDSPTQLLELNGTSNLRFAMGADHPYIQTNNQDLNFGTRTADLMVIKSGGNVLIGTTSNIASSKLRLSGNLQIEGFQKMYTYAITVEPLTTGTITISSPTGTNIQGSMQVMAGGYGNGLTGNITGLWMVGGLLFFDNASTSTITQIVNSVTSDGSMSFQRSGNQYTVTLNNTASFSSHRKSFYVSVIINGD